MSAPKPVATTRESPNRAKIHSEWCTVYGRPPPNICRPASCIGCWVGNLSRPYFPDNRENTGKYSEYWEVSCNCPELAECLQCVRGHFPKKTNSERYQATREIIPENRKNNSVFRRSITGAGFIAGILIWRKYTNSLTSCAPVRFSSLSANLKLGNCWFCYGLLSRERF